LIERISGDVFQGYRHQMKPLTKRIAAFAPVFSKARTSEVFVLDVDGKQCSHQQQRAKIRTARGWGM